MNSRIIYWPTILVCLGFAEFLFQVILGSVDSLSFGFSVIASFVILFRDIFYDRQKIKKLFSQMLQEVKQAPIAFQVLLALASFILLVAALESRMPPHLPQETDMLTYHMSLARQHLIQKSLAHIPWSTADLWPMTVQWGLSPFWFFSSVFHKIPQYLILLWLFGLSVSLGRRILKDYRGWLPAVAFITTHGVMIQLGTGMLDIANLYFLIAAIQAVLLRQKFWAVLNLGVFASTKAFMPIQTVIILIFMAVYYFIFEKVKPKSQKGLFNIVGLGALVCCAFLARSAYYSLDRAGTPLFPFLTCQIASPIGCEGELGQSVKESASKLSQVRDVYGEGRGVLAFAKHLWTVSVPSSGVNNRFDYPLGLSWLLWVVFFVFQFIVYRKTKKLNFYFVLALAFWATWWMGSQQSRWLYPVILLGWLGSFNIISKVNQKLLLSLLCISALFSLVSQWRGVRAEIFSSRAEVQHRLEASVDENSVEILYSKKPFTEHHSKNPIWILTAPTKVQ